MRHPRSRTVQATAATALVTTAETVVATLDGITSRHPDQVVALRGEAQLTTGAATTAVTPRIRRDSVTGTIVGEGNPITIGAAAGGTEVFEITARDSLTAERAGMSYVLTLEQTGATGNGSCIFATLQATLE